jgi:hypothetical protein
LDRVHPGAPRVSAGKLIARRRARGSRSIAATIASMRPSGEAQPD